VYTHPGSGHEEILREQMVDLGLGQILLGRTVDHVLRIQILQVSLAGQAIRTMFALNGHTNKAVVPIPEKISGALQVGEGHRSRHARHLGHGPHAGELSRIATHKLDGILKRNKNVFKCALDQNAPAISL
jgi:hypothetical protein